MQTDRSPSFLRRALMADAVISGATGLMMMLGAGLLEGLLGVPAALMRYAGASLLPFAAFVGYLAVREQTASAAVWTVIVINALWAVASFALVFGGFVAPTALGLVFILGQAVVVALFGELQFVALRRRAAHA